MGDPAVTGEAQRFAVADHDEIVSE